ncbi:MAG: transposase [Candidatus Levybacteria bacterium]|nr:transposase [Candidatus Levybacteria bacterium]
MPGRNIPIITGEIYHVFNRGIDRRPTFTRKREYERAVDATKFYLTSHPPMSFSKYLRLENEKKNAVVKLLSDTTKHVHLLSFCLMPNHFHFLVRQTEEHGISHFLSNFQNSYTRYFNTKHDRVGSLFLDQFKAVRIETDEQLIHVSRYIHLNPYTGYVVKSLDELITYPWSSLPAFLHDDGSFIEKEPVLSFFKSPNEYKAFIFDQADYQRRLKEIEHLVFE